MDLADAGLTEQPFRTDGKPLPIVSYSSHLDALESLRETCALPTGLALLQGPPLSGKSTLIQYFLDTMEHDCAVAVVDGNGLNTPNLLEAVLHQFGYKLECSSANELLAMLRVFALQQAASQEPPLLIIDNTQSLDPDALHALCELAELTVRRSSALKMVLSSDRSLESIISAPAMARIAKRVSADIHLHPLARDEAPYYLHAKLRAAGSDVPEHILPSSVCKELWQASGGWPGILDRIALLALARANALPVSISRIERPLLPPGTWDDDVDHSELMARTPPGPPQLYLSHNGDSVEELSFDRSRLLIGRSEHNDLSIRSKFISRHHLLLVRHSGSTFMMDLNSTNGTFVNSRRISNHILEHDDVITVGHHHIRFRDSHATKRGLADDTKFADTAIMKTLEDMRKLLAKENTEVLPAVTENLPTAGHLSG